jgi:hypothetical protein
LSRLALNSPPLKSKAACVSTSFRHCSTSSISLYLSRPSFSRPSLLLSAGLSSKYFSSYCWPNSVLVLPLCSFCRFFRE